MTTFTTSDLATRVLKDLGLVGAEETPTAADLDWAIQTVESEIEGMEARGIRIWNGSGVSIPTGYLTALSRRICLVLGPSFGLSDVAAAEVAIPQVEKTLRAIGASPPTDSVAQAEYF